MGVGQNLGICWDARSDPQTCDGTFLAVAALSLLPTASGLFGTMVGGGMNFGDILQAVTDKGSIDLVLSGLSVLLVQPWGERQGGLELT